MKKCSYSFIYEQVGDNKLVSCNLPNRECVYQGKTFNSSANSEKYIVCNKKGLAEKTTENEFYQKIEEGRRIHLITDNPDNPQNIIYGILIL